MVGKLPCLIFSAVLLPPQRVNSVALLVNAQQEAVHAVHAFRDSQLSVPASGFPRLTGQGINTPPRLRVQGRVAGAAGAVFAAGGVSGPPR
jgi:hypothetical protein